MEKRGCTWRGNFTNLRFREILSRLCNKNNTTQMEVFTTCDGAADAEL